MHEELMSAVSEMRAEVKKLRRECQAIAVSNRSTEQLLQAALTSRAVVAQPLSKWLPVPSAVLPSFDSVSPDHPGVSQFPPVDSAGSGAVEK